MPPLSLGNPHLDYVLGGGIQQQKCTILAGEPGSGKTTLAIQFITDPNIIDGKCAYLCIDKKPENIMKKATQLNPSAKTHIESGDLKFVEIAIDDWQSDHSINDLLLSIQLQIDAFFQNFKPSRVIVDSLLPYPLVGSHAQQKQYFMREFLQIIASYNATSIALLYDVSVHHFLWLYTGLVSDQLIFTRSADLDYETYWVAVSKNNDHNHKGKYRYTFDSKKGIHLKNRLC